MSNFSVSHGHTYHKPVQQSTRQALAGSTQQNREGSVVPESQGASEKETQEQEDMDVGEKTVWDALRMTLHFGKEYSDDMPLVGEPGNFRFSKSKDAASQPSQTKGQSQTLSSPAGTPSHSRAASVVAPMTGNPSTAGKGAKTADKATPVADAGGKAKRKKSKIEGGSP